MLTGQPQTVAVGYSEFCSAIPQSNVVNTRGDRRGDRTGDRTGDDVAATIAATIAACIHGLTRHLPT